MKNTLWIQAESELLTINLLNGDKIIDSLKKSAGPKSDQLLKLIAGLLEKNRIDVKNLSGIKLHLVSDSFTGTRIKTAVVKSLSFALDIPVKIV